MGGDDEDEMDEMEWKGEGEMEWKGEGEMWREMRVDEEGNEGELRRVRVRWSGMVRVRWSKRVRVRCSGG